MNITPILLEHQEILTPLWRKLCAENDIKLCEYSFSNAFLFQRNHSYRFVDAEIPYVQGEFEDGTLFFIPSFPPDHPFIQSLLKEKAIFPIPDTWLHHFPSSSYNKISSRENSDYLYSKHKLATLEGRHLSSRRNLLHQLEENYFMTSKHLDENNIDVALSLLEHWQEESGLTKEKTDYFSCKKGLENFHRLGLGGRIAYADDFPIGFTLYDHFCSQTAFLISAKSLKQYKGATPYLYKDFAINLPDSVQWINLEQDLGIPSLQHAKMAYVPDLIADKWLIHRKSYD